MIKNLVQHQQWFHCKAIKLEIHLVCRATCYLLYNQLLRISVDNCKAMVAVTLWHYLKDDNLFSVLNFSVFWLWSYVMLDTHKYHYSACLQFPRVKDTSFTGVTVEECKILLSGMDSVIYINATEHFGNTLPLQFTFFSPNLQEICNRWMKRKRDCGKH